MRERAPPKDCTQRFDPTQHHGELTKGMPHCGDGLRSELSDGSVDCSKDILCSPADGLRRRPEANTVAEPTVRVPHRTHCEPSRMS